MAATKTVVRARIDAATEGRATPEEKRLPLDAWVPNAATVRATRELARGAGTRFESARALFDDLGI